MGELLQIASLPTETGPLTYQIAEAGTVDWQSAFAHYDGTSASGSFLAALTVRSQNGAIVARVWPSTTFAAGDVGDVTFVPFGVGEASSAGLTFEQEMILLGATASLLGWWRLGDAASPFLDSNPYLSHTDEVQHSIGNALTTQVAGCLPADQDDGAVRFNGGTSAGDYLSTGATNAGRFDFTNGDFSVTCFIKPLQEAPGWSGGVVGNTNGGTVNNAGWGLFVDLVPAGLHRVVFRRAQDGGTLVDLTTDISAGSCLFIAGTYSHTTGAALYVNGVLAASDATTFSATATGLGVFIGKLGIGNTSTQEYFFGSVDEVAVWGSTLSAADIAGLYAAARP